jgi:glycosyltransferase involved in cell wall biosynthesis
MRILHVATLITPDGAYGGPIRVAVNQLRELASLGHEVELVAGTRGFGENLPDEIDGVPVRLFDVRQAIPHVGYAGLTAPGLKQYVRRHLPDVDVVHVHLARDLITMPVAAMVARSLTPLVVQPHGMIIEPKNGLAKIFDRLFTSRILPECKSVLTLTDDEAASLRIVAGSGVNLESIINGVPSHEMPDAADQMDVLFLARLQERKRPQLFVQMALQLLEEGFDATFSLVGPDEGQAAAVEKLIADSGASDKVRWEGALAPHLTIDRIAACGIYVLPSVGEVFPMSVLEAMSVGRPIVITSSNGLAVPLRSSSAAVVVDESLDGLVDAVRTLLQNRALRDEVGANARDAAERNYTMRVVAHQLELAYSAPKMAIENPLI